MPKMRLLMHRARNRGVVGVKAGGGKTWYTTGPYINFENLTMSEENPLELMETEEGFPMVSESDQLLEQE